jgi:hypothetical protein
MGRNMPRKYCDSTIPFASRYRAGFLGIWWHALPDRLVIKLSMGWPCLFRTAGYPPTQRSCDGLVVSI